MESKLVLARFVTTLVHLPETDRLFFRVRCGSRRSAEILRLILGQGRVRDGSLELEGAGTGLALTALGVPENFGNLIEEWYLERSRKTDRSHLEDEIAVAWCELIPASV